MCSSTGSGACNDSKEPYLPTDSEENGGNRVTLTNGQVVHAFIGIQVKPHITESRKKELSYLGFRLNTSNTHKFMVGVINKNNNEVIAKMINDHKFFYAYPT